MPKRILLIDSDESFAQGLAAAANAGGFKALTATNSRAVRKSDQLAGE